MIIVGWLEERVNSRVMLLNELEVAVEGALERLYLLLWRVFGCVEDVPGIMLTQHFRDARIAFLEEAQQCSALFQLLVDVLGDFLDSLRSEALTC